VLELLREVFISAIAFAGAYWGLVRTRDGMDREH
jgi:hypothetical protein